MDKITNGLIGLALGDALGVPYEFMSRAEVIRHYRDTPVGAPAPFSSRWGQLIPVGAWSDDTSMTVATMESICDKRCIDWNDIMNNFMKWWYRGDFCSLKHPFGLGGTISEALDRFIHGVPAEECGGNRVMDNGNGALMRIYPFAVIAAYRKLSDDQIVSLVNTASAITHAHGISQMSCVFFVRMMTALFAGKDVRAALADARGLPYRQYYPDDVIEAHRRLLTDDFVSDAGIKESGYVVSTLEGVVYSLLHSTDYASAIRTAIRLGYDTDTTACITGAAAGVLYSSFPAEWLAVLRKQDYLRRLACEFAKVVPSLPI